MQAQPAGPAVPTQTQVTYSPSPGRLGRLLSPGQCSAPAAHYALLLVLRVALRAAPWQRSPDEARAARGLEAEVARAAAPHRHRTQPPRP